MTSLKSDIDQLNIDKLGKRPTVLNSLKSKVDKLDVDKLSPFHFYLKKLSEVVDNDVAKQTAYNKLGKNVSATQTSGTCNLTKKIWL